MKYVLIALLAFQLQSVSAQNFQVPTDLTLGKGNPFDDPNFVMGREMPEGICGNLPVLARDNDGNTTACFPFDPSDSNECTAHYTGCSNTVKEREDSLKVVEDANKNAFETIKKLTEENKAVKLRLQRCKSSRGRRC